MSEAILNDQSKNPELKLAFDFIKYTNRNIFLTGNAGTGKTTFLVSVRKASPKRMIVVAPTGVAAINAGGVTIHSFFQLPFRPHIPSLYTGHSHDVNQVPTYKLGREKINIIKSLDLLVIDEISMVRADLLDAVDSVLRKFRDKEKPFGGVQLLMIGDIQQLPPVVRDEEWKILGSYYVSPYFFSSLALEITDYVTIELKHIYRQKDLEFIGILNRIRNNTSDASVLNELNKCFKPDFESASGDGYITLTTHNARAAAINDSRLEKLPGPVHSFRADISGDFPEYSYPAFSELFLKKGAQVMFVKNDISRDKLYFNGKIGTVEDIRGSSVIVKCPGEPSIEVEKAEWQNVKYTLDEETKEIGETVTGTFIQYPLRLAWAITIHKSQGLTFDRAIIDAKDAFAHGQVYVALSRCRTLDGIILISRLNGQGIKCDPEISVFTSETQKNQPGDKHLEEAKQLYQQELLLELFDFGKILSELYYVLKIGRDNREVLLGNVIEDLDRIISPVRSDLIEVALKFRRQLVILLKENPGIDNNPLLQERLNRACDYFLPKIEDLLKNVNGLKYETDNRSVKKSLNASVLKLKHSVNIRLACLSSCREDGFSISAYLEARAKADLNEQTGTKPRSGRQNETLTEKIENPELFSALKLWRNKKASAMNIQHYRVLQLKTLALLANNLPGTPAALKKIKGIGDAKYRLFGDELLHFINNYCASAGIKQPSDTLPEKEEKVKKEESRSVSLRLYREGRSAEEIAASRQMSLQTIEGHLAYYVSTGELDIGEFVDPVTVSKITKEINSSGETKLSPVKAALGDEISWSDIKFVLKHHEFLKGKD
jgi:hypothetical protein